MEIYCRGTSPSEQARARVYCSVYEDRDRWPRGRRPQVEDDSYGNVYDGLKQV